MRENERRLRKMIKFNNYDSFECDFVVATIGGDNGSPFTMSAIKKFLCPIFFALTHVLRLSGLCEKIFQYIMYMLLNVRKELREGLLNMKK